MLRARNNSSGPGVSFTSPGPKGKRGRREQLPEQGETAQWGQDHPAGAVTFHPRTILMTVEGSGTGVDLQGGGDGGRRSGRPNRRYPAQMPAKPQETEQT